MAYNAATVRIAKAAVRHAKLFHCPDLGCIDCGQLPSSPVTSFCGHTRCLECATKTRQCPCGSPSAPETQKVNVLVRNLITKMQVTAKPVSATLPGTEQSTSRDNQDAPAPIPPKMYRHRRCNIRNCRCISQKSRISHAKDLMKLGEFMEAAPHLAHAASTTLVNQNNDRKVAYNLLLKCINELTKNEDERQLTREIARRVRSKKVDLMSNINSSDLECPICLEPFTRPFSSKCGHTFCRNCVIKSVYNQKVCAICRHPLEMFDVVLSDSTAFVDAALELANVPSSPPSNVQMIPIFNCTVAFPTIPCPILTLGPYHGNIIRMILDSGSRRFGMVTAFKDGTLAVSGTIVEIRDCVQLQDGRTILSTVGVTRFRTLKRTIKEKSHLALVVDLKDVPPTEEEYISLNLERLAQSITEKVMKWLSSLTIPIIAGIEAAFGPMPRYKDEYRWWTNPDCPKWLWWIIAILPFSPELQVLMLSTIHLHKRMLAVSRTLDVIKHIGLNPSICY